MRLFSFISLQQLPLRFYRIKTFVIDLYLIFYVSFQVQYHDTGHMTQMAAMPIKLWL